MPLGPPPAETVQAAYKMGDYDGALGRSVINLSKQFQKAHEVREKLAKKSAKDDLDNATEARAKHIMTNQHGWTKDDLNKYGHKNWTEAMEFHQQKEREKYDPSAPKADLPETEPAPTTRRPPGATTTVPEKK